mmetsp:Transcript_16588/g.41490  ORF Transcript_16588/g.41490 Transcript_16588/m.41490 type:complete len:142 (+) Transcript_16588:64-489(+)
MWGVKPWSRPAHKDSWPELQAEEVPMLANFVVRAAALGTATRVWERLCQCAALHRPSGTASVSRGGALDAEDFGDACEHLGLVEIGCARAPSTFALFKQLDMDAEQCLTLDKLISAFESMQSQNSSEALIFSASSWHRLPK